MKFFKRRNQAKYFWLDKTLFISNFIELMQNELDKTDCDFRLVYKQSLSFPKKYWKVEIEFPDKKLRTNAAQLDEIHKELITDFKNSPEYDRVRKILYWFSECNWRSFSTIEISYVLSDSCTKSKNPGVIIYWEK